MPGHTSGSRRHGRQGSLHRIAGALDVDLGELLGRDNMPDAAPDAGVVALRQAVADVADLLGDVEGEPLSLRDAKRSVTRMRASWRRGVHWISSRVVMTPCSPRS